MRRLLVTYMYVIWHGLASECMEKPESRSFAPEDTKWDFRIERSIQNNFKRESIVGLYGQNQSYRALHETHPV